jgi:hypothetical protein
MPSGFQAWDASGTLIIDISTRTGFVIGSVAITSGNQSSSVTDATFANGTPFYFIIADTGESIRHPFVSFSGTTMTWTKSTASNFSGNIYYGVF